MRSERGEITFGPVVGIIVIVLALVGLFAICGDDDVEEVDMPATVLVDHERGRCYDGDCGGDYGDDWNSDQRNHNGRERGAFSPGPFDDSPVDAFNGNVICLPGSTCYGDDRDDRDDPDEEPMP